jgi:hypothetical protein
MTKRYRTSLFVFAFDNFYENAVASVCLCGSQRLPMTYQAMGTSCARGSVVHTYRTLINRLLANSYLPLCHDVFVRACGRRKD